MSQSTFTDRLRALPRPDRMLLTFFVCAALLALTLGVVFGAATAAARAGFVGIDPFHGYRLMSQHGVSIFFYWLYFAQAGLLLAFAASHAAGAARLHWRGVAWAGLALMATGFGSSMAGTLTGMPLLYDAPPDLAAAGGVPPAAFYTGYLLLGVGLFCVAAAAVATSLAPRSAGAAEELSAVSFAAIAWSGLLMVSAVAGVNAFLPAMRWALGWGPLPAGYSTSWHVLFHNMHYLPLMATVLVWYVLVKVLTGVESIYGARFAKIVFSTYLVFVPPTSLYHMFLEPGLAEPARVIGSLLSLFISVPTVLVFLVIVASLETRARAHGARGLFGWVRELPWRNPAMSAIGVAVVNLAAGGALSFVLIQGKLAPLLSDTFFVPGYFHFLTVGTVTLTFLAAFCYVVPALSGRPLWRPGFLAALPWIVTGGLALFGAAGVVAGYLGVPRRMLDVSFGGAAPHVWLTLMTIMGSGAAIMALSLLAWIFVLVRALLPGTPRAAVVVPPTVDWSGASVGRTRAWVGPLSVLTLVATMTLFTVLAFEMMQALPLAATGGGGH
ncbi:MAG: cbb3-type cytochrome c oxidase subunit I [Burkholderiales bacterium]|nr:cbb3-type cytochrome c oxidase subunit I [Burkholderiales bacterium]